MRIGITCHPSMGGSGVVASELGKFLAKRGHSVHFITSGIPFRLQGGYQENLFFHNVEMEPYPLFEYPPYDLALAAKMREVADAEKLDLLHVHYALPHAISAFLAAQMMQNRHLPFVTTLHGTDITLVGTRKEYFDVVKLGLEKSDAVTSVSDWLAQRTVEVFKPTKPIERVHNFVDPDLFKRNIGSCQHSQFARIDQVLYVHMSNFRPVKRIEDVVRIFDKIRREVDAVLLMVGEGPMQRPARDLAVQLGIRDRIKFLGNQHDVVGILGCGDVFLFPSELESFGLAPLEAMACEIPVIGSESGGLPEVVEHGVTGYLAKPGEIEKMAAYGISLGLSQELRATMGEAGRARALKYFHPDAICAQYEAIYQRVIQ